MVMEKELLAKVVQSFRFNGSGTGKTKSMFDQVSWVSNQGTRCLVVCEGEGQASLFEKAWMKRYHTLTSANYVMPRFLSLDEFAKNLPDPHVRNQSKVIFDPSLLIGLLTELLQPPKEEKVECRECNWLLILTGNEELRDVQDAYVAHIEEKHRPSKKEEPKVHVCSAAGHVQCVKEGYRSPEREDLSKLIPVGWYSVHTKGKVIPFAPKEFDPELALTVGQMKELFDNLVMEGFTEEEALSIVAQVSRK